MVLEEVDENTQKIIPKSGKDQQLKPFTVESILLFCDLTLLIIFITQYFKLFKFVIIVFEFKIVLTLT